MEQTILTPWHQSVLKLVSQKPELANFYLSLAKVKRIEALPRMIKQLTIEELRTFFTAQARQLKPAVLDV